MNITEVSIVIVNWNTCNILRDCLVSVYKQTESIEFEVIVVDNASTDNSVAMVKTQFPQAILIQNDVNRGFAAANNQGIEIARGRYVLLLNPDTVVLYDAITKGVSFADAHPDAAIVGCRVLNPDRTLQSTCFMFPSILNLVLSSSYLYKLFPKIKLFGREQMTWWDRTDEREVDVVTGCFMLVKREAINQVGLMDEQFFMYGEETDWCYRFKHTGWKILFTPDAEIMHLGGQSSKQAAPEMALQLRGSILRFISKHRSRLEYKLACVLVLFFFVLRVPVWFIKSIVDGANRHYCWMRLTIYLSGIKKLTLGGGEGLCIRASDSKS